MKAEKFDSKLGEVAVTRTRVERDTCEAEEWERIRDNFSEEKLVDVAEYESIERIQLEKGSVYPSIKLMIDGEWKRLFFQVGDQADECYKRLRYRWNAYQQNH